MKPKNRPRIKLDILLCIWLLKMAKQGMHKLRRGSCNDCLSVVCCMHDDDKILLLSTGA